jgi:hypothetical protein
VERLTIQQSVSADFGPLRLLGFERDRTSVRQGEVLYLGLFWQASGSLPDLLAALSLEPEAGGERLLLWEGQPVRVGSLRADVAPRHTGWRICIGAGSEGSQ